MAPVRGLDAAARLASVDADAVERFADRITAMYGTEEWRDAYLGRLWHLLTGAELRDELLNLMRWRLEKVLGYRVTHSFEMKNTRGSPSTTWSSPPITPPANGS